MAENCKRCGSHNPSWSAPSPLWNAVMRGGSIDGDPLWGDLVCMTCFAQLAEAQGIAALFRVTADVVNVELETVTPSGRVWNDDEQMWQDPQPLCPDCEIGPDVGDNCPVCEQRWLHQKAMEAVHAPSCSLSERADGEVGA
jgi:hypothetical protein